MGKVLIIPVSNVIKSSRILKSAFALPPMFSAVGLISRKSISQSTTIYLVMQTHTCIGWVVLDVLVPKVLAFLLSAQRQMRSYSSKSPTGSMLLYREFFIPIVSQYTY